MNGLHLINHEFFFKRRLKKDVTEMYREKKTYH